MVIKYRCWDESAKKWREPNLDNMVSMFVVDERNAVRIVPPLGYTFVLFTGFEDSKGRDIYPGDILDDEFYVNWDILKGRWSLFDRETELPVYSFLQYRPAEHEVTGTTFEDADWSVRIS